MAGAEDARPPGFPSVEELKELNREIHEDAGFPEHFKLDQRSPLDSCPSQARTAYAATPEGVIQTAALIAHGIARAQAFRDGNRRTAYFATRTFLGGAGYGYLTSADGVSHVVQTTTSQPQTAVGEALSISATPSSMLNNSLDGAAPLAEGAVLRIS